MTDSKHTPGPWAVGSKKTVGGPLLVTGAPYSPGFPGRPTVCNLGLDTDPRHQADARLIAAAPELLAALVVAERELLRLMEMSGVEIPLTTS